ncbi:peptidoglycan recognition protein 5 [Pempheris klunzingeri]|uniref:peptidoglycan recognition protein 5 n=1 Tax=Pempheris klunzingeri TaxID=3127111 RepID=UPI003981759A
MTSWKLHSLLPVSHQEPKASVDGAMDQKVPIVSRQQWGAAAPRQKEALKGPAQRVVIHHTALSSCVGLKECTDRLVSIQRMHMTDRGFDDIGYNFLVGGDGTVYEGRGWGVIGAHTKGNNHDSLGIAFMGSFNNDTPSKEAISSVKRLLQSGVSQGCLRQGFLLFGHRDLGNTECPGGKLYAALPQLRATT